MISNIFHMGCTMLLGAKANEGYFFSFKTIHCQRLLLLLRMGITCMGGRKKEMLKCVRVCDMQ